MAAFVLAYGTQVVLHALLTAVGFRRTQRLLQAIIPDRAVRCGANRLPTQGAEPVGRACDRAVRLYVRRGHCLRRSLALWAWLRWSGVNASIAVGVRHDDDALVGHAWVEVEHRSVAEPAGVRAENVLVFSSRGSSS